MEQEFKLSLGELTLLTQDDLILIINDLIIAINCIVKNNIIIDNSYLDELKTMCDSYHIKYTIY